MIWRKKYRKKVIYIGNCKLNHKGSSGAMETERLKRISQISEAERNLQCTEMVTGKAFMEVEDVYDGKSVKKKECMGHVQKRVETV